MYYGEFDLKRCQRHEKPDDGGGRPEIVFILYLYNHRMYKKTIYFQNKLIVQNTNMLIYNKLKTLTISQPDI